MVFTFDFKPFENMNIQGVALALYCHPSDKPDAHTDRTYQGIVMNEPHGRRIYYFSDGTELLTEPYEIFFLPKGSTYRVVPLHSMERDSGCYCINFISDISSAPFSVKPKNPETYLNLFNTASRLWRSMDRTAHNVAARTVLDVLLGLEKESRGAYMPNSKDAILAPAMEKIKSSYTERNLSVKTLAKLCGISETYFRQLFFSRYGATPKEYLINLRIRYAKELLSSGELSVSGVAFMCGYSEPCHFSREFSRITGVCPSDYLACK